MLEKSNVINPERYAFEAGSMRLDGSVADRGNGRCTVRGRFEDESKDNEVRFEFRSVARKSFADLFRSFADNIAPVNDGAYSLWCEVHVGELEGRPTFLQDDDTKTWSLRFDEMECPHADERQWCRPSWRTGLVTLGDGRR